MELKKKAYLWNTISSVLNAGMSALLLLIVNRVCGSDVAGIFALAFSVAQLMMCIGNFEVRPYLVTDVQRKFTDNEYYNFKLFSCTLMMSVSIGYSLLKGYRGDKLFLVLLLCVFKMLDTFEDYYVALYQRENNLGEGAKRSSIRVGISLIVFSVVTIISQNLYLGVCSTIIISIVLIIAFFVVKENPGRKLKLQISGHWLFGIASACFPMFLHSYMALYVGNAPKYALDELMAEEFQTIYGILYMPSFVINLFSEFAFKPIISDIAYFYYTDRRKYRELVFRSIMVVLGISAVVLMGGFLLGIPVLGWVYGIDLSDYRIPLMIVLLSGMVGAIVVILYYIMTIKRVQQWLLISDLLTALAAMLTAGLIVEYWGIMGACAACLGYNTLRMLLVIATMIWNDKREQKDK